MKNHWLIIADGERLSPTRLQQLAAERRVLACDGAGYTCLEHNITPETVLGDMDTLDQASQQRLRELGVDIQHTPDQNSTDTEKTICYALEQGATDITLCQAVGDRTDHSLMNLRLLRRYYSSPAKLRVAREHEIIFFAQNEALTFDGSKDRPIAILGFDTATVTSKGLKYELSQTQLGADFIDSTSNQLVSDAALVEIEGQALIVCGDK